MTPTLCAAFCTGFKFYGLEYSSQCFCGNVFQDGYPKVEDGDCNYVCSGDNSENCGGFWRLDLYSATGASVPTINYNLLGCYVDDSNRALRDKFHEDDKMTPLLCAGFCSHSKYFGVEYSSQCFCGNVLQGGYPKTPDGDCNYTCAGNSSEMCGGFWRLGLYQIQ
jgi:hypothetical protein